MRLEKGKVAELQGLDKYVEIYPLMSTGVFMIKFGVEIQDQVNIDVHDKEGNTSYSKKLKGALKDSTVEINLKGKTRGVYMVMVQINSSFTTKKVLLE